MSDKYRSDKKEIKHLYRYMRFPKVDEPNNDKYSEGLVNLFVHNKLYFPSPKDFNDPFDCKVDVSFDDCTNEDIEKFCLKGLKFERRPSKDIKRLAKVEVGEASKNKAGWIQKMRRNAKEILQPDVDRAGVLCMSAKNDDILMWSHYSDRHKGFCLEFDKTILDSHFYCKRIVYNSSFPTFKRFNNVFPNNNKKSIDLFFLRKSNHWKYECEWRVIIKPEENTENPRSRYLQYPEEMLTGVIFGCEMLEEDKNKIRNWIKDRLYKPTIPYNARKKENAFGLKIERE